MRRSSLEGAARSHRRLARPSPPVQPSSGHRPDGAHDRREDLARRPSRHARILWEELDPQPRPDRRRRPRRCIRRRGGFVLRAGGHLDRRCAGQRDLHRERRPLQRVPAPDERAAAAGPEPGRRAGGRSGGRRGARRTATSRGCGSTGPATSWRARRCPSAPSRSRRASRARATLRRRCGARTASRPAGCGVAAGSRCSRADTPEATGGRATGCS